METSLHRQLKADYATGRATCETPVAGYRIDVARGRHLIEIQHGSLAALRDKVNDLLRDQRYRVTVVKPIVARKRLVKLDRRGGNIVETRWSPKQRSWISLFDELVHFTNVFPQRGLGIDVLLVEIEESRYPGHGRRRRRRANDFEIDDQRLVEIIARQRLTRASHLLNVLPARLPQPFHTGQLAEALCCNRDLAQRIAYCLRKTGVARTVGKQGNAVLYRTPRQAGAGTGLFVSLKQPGSE